MIFNSTFTDHGALPSFDHPDEVRDEPMIFGADFDTAVRLGGTITQAFMAAVDELWPGVPVIVDSRTHMLMPGWYPCIGGWHLDEAPRGADGQPDIASPDYTAEHLLAIVDAGTGSLTEFVTTSFGIEYQDISSDAVYASADQIISRGVLGGHLKTQTVPSGRLIGFGPQGWHRGQPATGHGWRFFIRATRNSKRPIKNERRQQVQVYLPSMDAGW